MVGAISIYAGFYLLKELDLNGNLSEAFIIGVDEKAKQRLDRLFKEHKVSLIHLDQHPLPSLQMVQSKDSGDDDELFSQEDDLEMPEAIFERATLMFRS